MMSPMNTLQMNTILGLYLQSVISPKMFVFKCFNRPVSVLLSRLFFFDGDREQLPTVSSQLLSYSQQHLPESVFRVFAAARISRQPMNHKLRKLKDWNSEEFRINLYQS